MSTATPVSEQESFAALFEESLARQEMRTGEVITAEVVRIDQNFVVVNAGLKSESYVPIDEFRNDHGELEANVGDFIHVAIDALEDGFGETRLSRDKAKRIAAWNDLEKALNEGALVKGVITGRVKGGLTVMTNGIRAFLPGSLVDMRPVKDTTPYEGKEYEFKVIKLDRKRNNVVVSRRAVLEESMGEEREKLLSNLKEGAIVKGIVKNITDYGAFVDLGGIDGLLHITDLAWRRVRHPSEVLNVGDEIEAKVLKFDQEKNRVSLGLKQLGEDPWVGIARRYPQGTRLFGKVTNITDYGAFVGLDGGIDGLVHLSDLSWSESGEDAVRRFKKGDEVEAVVLAIDVERERISLGVKQLEGDPFTNFIATHEKNTIVRGTVKSVEARGAVISLSEEVEGYLRASEAAAHRVDDLTTVLKEGEEVEAVIINVDRKTRSISLSIRAKDQAEQSEAMQKLASESSAATGTTNLGALLKAKLNEQKQ
jgi:small subunit ribosomal protein S1